MALRNIPDEWNCLHVLRLSSNGAGNLPAIGRGGFLLHSNVSGTRPGAEGADDWSLRPVA